VTVSNDQPQPPTTSIVVCHGLAREEIGDERFKQELWARRHWLAENCRHPYEITSLREKGRLIGRRFLFACEVEATAFKLWFSTTIRQR